MTMAGRTETDAFLGIGSNMDDREENILKGLDLVDGQKKIRLLAASPFYETDPVGPSRDRYLNGAAWIRTSLAPAPLLRRLKRIEKKLGRKASAAWGEPRPLDLDILLYGNSVVDQDRLKVPHPGLLDRDFALRPLLDLAPGARHPSTGARLRDALAGAAHRTIVAGPFPLPAAPAYRMLEHTADMGMEVKAATRRRLFEACAEALADIMVDRSLLRESVRFDAVIEGDDFQQILVELLQEVLYLVDARRFLPVRVSVALGEAAEEGGRVAAAFFGRPITQDEVKTGVKAATYHMLEVLHEEREPRPWTARVYFDV
jgi:2-amino-4-hydroxy-6-hydroxymethyldihydropteridine diphosphokinase